MLPLQSRLVHQQGLCVGTAWLYRQLYADLISLASQQNSLRQPLLEVLRSHACCCDVAADYQSWVLPAMQDLLTCVLNLDTEDSKRSAAGSFRPRDKAKRYES